MDIRYFKHKEIDKEKWDTCIDNASNSLIYAFSWYLDIVSPNWEALIAGDYHLVMPLPAKRKYGINYLFQPKYTQQLGVFGVEPSIEPVSDFISKIPKKFIFVDLNF